MAKVHPNAAAPETKIPAVSGDGCGGDGAAVALTVWRRSLLFNGKGFTVFDAKGNLVFRVDDYASGSRGEVVLMDAEGKPLLTIRRKRLSLSERWIVYKGEEVGGEPLFSVRKHVTLLPSPALAHVTGGYAVEGSYARRSVAVYDAARRPIAAVEAKGAAVGRDVFRLVVAPAFDSAAAMAIVILLDRMFAPRRRSLILPRVFDEMGSSGSSWKLVENSKFPKGKIVAVVVLDGWGEADPDEFNCIHLAETPTMDSLKKGAPEKWRLLKAHGTAVGLPTDDDMGNSEVGHNALGAGRIYAQGAKLVDMALASGKIYEGEGFKYIKECFENGTLHLIGLLSDGGVHSRFDQLQMLLKGACEHGAKRIRVHIITDGRDCLDGTSVGFVEMLENDLAKLREKGVDTRIASGGGRMYVTMDRYENDWGVVKRGWDAHVLGEAPHKFRSAIEAVKKLREDPKANDQYLPPFVIVDESGKPVGPVMDGDAVVTFNFRADRMVMIAKALEYENFDKFDRVRFPKIHYAGMLQYDGELKLPSHYLVSPPEIERTSGEYLVHNGVRTFACSEAVKFGHVTFFWNGNRSGYFNPNMEEYFEIPSDAGITFDAQPKMKALEIAEKARDVILSRKFHQVRINLTNGDMVGHTGDIKATIVGCKAVDEAVKIVLDAIDQVGGIYLVTADHGNAEDMVKRDKSGKPLLDKNGNVQLLTSHTLHPVPVAIGGPGLRRGVRFREDLRNAGLANVAATVMNLHGFDAPSDYEPTLIEVVDGN